jgi:hypothetical protein
MGFVYGVAPQKWLVFDGSNIQEVADWIASPGETVQVDGSNRCYTAQPTIDHDAFDITLTAGDRVAQYNPNVVSEDDWNGVYLAVPAPGNALGE